METGSRQALKQERHDLRSEDLAQVRLDLREHVLRTLGPPEDPPSSEASQARTSRLPPLPALPAPPQPAPGSVAEAYGTFCTELLDVAGDDSAILEAAVAALPAPGPTEAEIQDAAASRIGATWRMSAQRRRYAELQKTHRAARRIQSGWHTSVVKSATRQELMRREEEERKLQTMMMYQIGQDWFQAKAMRRVEVHICSLSIAEHRRRRMDGYQVLQATQIARIFRLADPKRDIIFVAPKHIHEDVLDYYSKIMQFRGIQNPPGRFQVVVPENIDLKDKMSLTQALLCSPKALKRIRKLVSNRMAMLIPEAVTHVEAKLSCALRLPLIGPSSRNMSLLASKSNAKKLTQLAQLPTGPWAVDIYDEDEFFTCLAGLVIKHPKVRTWLFKIDDERGSRGTAYIDLCKLHQVQQSVHASAPALLGMANGAAEDEEPAIIGADANEVRAALQHHVPKRAVLCHRQVYGDFASWLAEACRIGCVIQAAPESMISQTSVHVQVAPDGAIDILGTSEAIMSTPFVRAASWYPHSRGSFEVLQEVGYRLGRCLAAKGFMGFASADVVFFENPDFDATELVSEQRESTPAIIGSDTPVNPEDLMFGNLRSPSPDISVDNGDFQPSADLPESRQADYNAALQVHEEQMKREQQSFDPVSLMLGGSEQGAGSMLSPFACWVVDVDARLTDEAAMLFPLKFIAQVKQDPATGLMQLTSEAQDGGAKAHQDLTEEEQQLRSQRWAMVNHVALAPQLEKMSHQVLFQAAKMRGVSFDLFHNVGCVFTFLDVVHKLFSLMVVDKTPEQCAKKMSAALSAIAEGQPNVLRSRHRWPGDTTFVIWMSSPALHVICSSARLL
ncbi:iqch [Symbiodinium natans]|uniref:Iqch protein n=1 Tax=Symbiodinium natans TaxID=878477 RepID=A0A812Q2Y0_9DINO|nr:iqch [Symbiodinium natans]